MPENKILYVEKKKRGTFSKGLVLFIVLANITFTAAVLFVFYHTGNEPSVLIGSWFAFTTGELWFLSDITKTKEKLNGGRDDGMGD